MRRAACASAQTASAPAYEPGHFTALVRRHDWPPRFQSRLPLVSAPDWSAISTANRERRVAQGDPGTIVGLTQKADEMIRQRLMHIARGVR
jgi:hypothetical protein